MDLKKKLENFFYYYKFHTAFVIFAIIVAILVFNSYLDKSKEFELTVVDSTVDLKNKDSKNLISAFAKDRDIKEDKVLFNTDSAYISDEKMEDKQYQIAGVKGVKEELRDGNIDLLFVYRTEEYDKDIVSDPQKVLPKVLLKEIEDYLVKYKETEDVIGILVNDAPNFKKYIGETENNIVIQISKDQKDIEKSIEFIKYLFDLN